MKRLLVKILGSKGLRQLIRLISALNNGVNRYLFVSYKFALFTVLPFEYKVHTYINLMLLRFLSHLEGIFL